MATILFDIFAATGHYNASFPLAKYLSKNNRIIYVCNSCYQKIVLDHGFETYVVDIDALHLLAVKRRLSGIWFFSDSSRKSVLGEMIKNYKQIEELFHPDLVLLDSHHFYKAIVYKGVCDHILRLQSMVSTYRLPYISPVCYDYLPSCTKKEYFRSAFLWGIYRLKCYVHQLIQIVLYPSCCYYANMTMLAELSGYPFYYYIDFNRYTVSCLELKGYPELVISPVAFDFPSTSRNVLTCFFSIEEDRDIHLFVPRYSALMEKLHFMKINKIFVVYCSLGTLSVVDKEKAICFFQKLKRVALMDDDLIFIFSVGKGLSHDVLLPLPKNILVFRQVPQFDLLQYCDLMITHGGMNSITECILRQVPMLVYPLNRSWDQPGNAARVVFHGLGLKGSISRDSPMTIYRKIKKISSSYFVYKENLQKMKQKVEETPDTLTPYINSIV